MADRAVRSGIYIPNWARRIDDSSGFDPSTLSPPTNEDDFLQFHRPIITRQQTEPPPTITIANHTNSCKQFLPGSQNIKVESTQRVTKPMGVDDGFKGPGAACGSSIVAMAQKMIHGKTVDDAVQPVHRRQRRNSKSLPASPLGSPESRRRVQNRFFTGDLLSTFFAKTVEENSASPQPEIPEATSYSTTDKINIKIDVSVNAAAAAASGFRPKPSELREMNFWSPTSM